MTEKKTYRHRKTGEVRQYTARFAGNFPDLIEVEPGTKPLAFTPIPESRVRAHKKKAADEAASTTSADAAKAEEN